MLSLAVEFERVCTSRNNILTEDRVDARRGGKIIKKRIYRKSA
jgi:hypothetical protein